jgi:hypothetical protein
MPHQGPCAARRRTRECPPLASTPGGFPLVELLAMITMLVILAGILLPFVSQARDRADRTAYLSQVPQGGQARLLSIPGRDERFSDRPFRTRNESGQGPSWCRLPAGAARD